jgi:hypothetical protein
MLQHGRQWLLYGEELVCYNMVDSGWSTGKSLAATVYHVVTYKLFPVFSWVLVAQSFLFLLLSMFLFFGVFVRF